MTQTAFTLWRVVLKVLYAIIVGAVIWHVINHLGSLSAYDFEVRPQFLVGAFLAAMLGYVGSIQLWRETSLASGIRVSWFVDGKAWVVSRLGRYIPGKIPAVLLRFGSYSTAVHRNVGTAMVVEALSTLFASSLFVLFILSGSSVPVPGTLKWVLLSIATMTALLSFSRILPTLASRIWRRVSSTITEWQFPTRLLLLKLSIGQVLVMLLHGLALYLTLNAVSDVSIRSYFVITGVYYFAGLMGVLAVFAPSGLGVREGVLLALLPLVADTPTVIVATILIRVITTFAELAMMAAFLGAGRLARFDR